MTETLWTEVPLFLHGITPDRRPGSHDDDYDALLGLVNGALRRRGKPPFSAEPIRVEWGWDSGQAGLADRLLATAEARASDAVRTAEKEARDLTLNPARVVYRSLRRNFLHGFADLFYYVSRDGERAVREHVFSVAAGTVNRLGKGARVSLTVFAHSAGSVIAHDLLYHLFGSEATPPECGEAEKEVLKARELVGRERLRVRRLYTLGSPITPLLVRADSLLKRLVEEHPLEPAELGLGWDLTLGNPRWVNFWDEDDIFAFPVAFNYAAGPHGHAVEDRYADLGDIFPTVHGRYWHSGKVAEGIAETW